MSGSETLTVLVEDTNSGDVLFGLVKAAAEKMGLPEEVRLSDDKELAEKHETALPALIIDGKAFAISEGASVEEIVRIIEKA